MSYRFSSLQPILDLFEKNEFLWASEISERLWKSRVIVHKYLKELLAQNKLQKTWEWSYVKYELVEKWNKYNIKYKAGALLEEEVLEEKLQLAYNNLKVIENNFYKYSSNWTLLKWTDWFHEWCQFRNINFDKALDNFIKVHKKIIKHKDRCGLLHAKKQFWENFEKKYVNNVYYADQYIWQEFWRGKLAEMTFFAKQSQNKQLIRESIGEIRMQLACHIQSKNYDAIAVAPWSIERKNQLLAILKKELTDFNLPIINLVKYFPSGIPIPQKSLKTQKERIHNAQNTIFIHDEDIWKYKKVFLIDDFVWSWATLNETAKKLKDEWVKKVDAFAFVWNLDLSYDVINEV